MSLSLFRKKSFVGLDLGAYLIKAVQVERAPNGWKVVRTAVMPTPPGAIKDGIIAEPDSVGYAIRDLLRDSKIQATSAVIGVSGGTVIVRTVRIPAMPEATLRKSIKYEAGRYVPSSVEDSFIEFEILGPAPENQMDVLVVASPREIVESRIRACEAAGIEVEIVDIEAFAVFRALIEADPASVFAQATVALVDVGASSTNVSVVDHGVFVMTRSIPQAGAVLTDALKTHFKLEPEDAEQGKAQLDLQPLLEPDAVIENPPLRVIQPHIDDLIREIRRSLNYYQSQQTDSGNPQPVTHLMVTGGGAKMTGLARYMSHKLGLETVCTGVFDNPRFVYSGTEEPGAGLDLCVATGLAMRAFAKAA